MRAYIKLTYYLVSIIFIYSCSPEPKVDSENITPPTSSNPMDSILGEKVINEALGEIRKSNFSDLLQLSKDDLLNKSNLYDVSELGDDFFILNQRRFYSEARLFSVLLKVEQENVVNYKVFNDFKIMDKSISSKDLFLLLGNFGNFNKFWKTDNEVQLIRFDNDLNQLWTYTLNSDQFPLEATKIKCLNDHVTVTINIITGCHICYNTFEIKIDNQGNCLSAIQIGEQNSSVVLSEETIDKIFKIPITKSKQH